MSGSIPPSNSSINRNLPLNSELSNLDSTLPTSLVGNSPQDKKINLIANSLFDELGEINNLGDLESLEELDISLSNNPPIDDVIKEKAQSLLSVKDKPQIYLPYSPQANIQVNNDSSAKKIDALCFNNIDPKDQTYVLVSKNRNKIKKIKGLHLIKPSKRANAIPINLINNHVLCRSARDAELLNTLLLTFQSNGQKHSDGDQSSKNWIDLKFVHYDDLSQTFFKKFEIYLSIIQKNEDSKETKISKTNIKRSISAIKSDNSNSMQTRKNAKSQIFEILISNQKLLNKAAKQKKKYIKKWEEEKLKKQEQSKKHWSNVLKSEDRIKNNVDAQRKFDSL